MDIVNTIIVLIGFICLGWYHKSRIAALERDLASQKCTLDRLGVYCDIFDPQRLQVWITNREESGRRQDDLAVGELHSLMEGLVAERFEKGKRIEREISALTDLTTRLLFYAPPNLREEFLTRMPNSSFKDAVRMVVDRMPKHGHCEIYPTED
jgi:hypothetical protein